MLEAMVEAMFRKRMLEQGMFHLETGRLLAWLYPVDWVKGWLAEHLSGARITCNWMRVSAGQ